MILDPTCGSKMFWFDKNPDDVIFGDIRRETHTLCDGLLPGQTSLLIVLPVTNLSEYVVILTNSLTINFFK